ncbi:SURF1 family protein [Nocardioides marmoraquaticus]
MNIPVLLRPRALGAHVLVVVAVAATIALGLWQLSAWQAGREREARDVSDATPVALDRAMGGDDPFPGQYLGHPVTLGGEWLPDSTLYVSDRARDGEWGYWVMTPVMVDGTDSAMPVVRGWSAEPSAPEVSGRVDVEGWLQPSEGSSLNDPDRTDDVIPEMRVASVTEHVDDDLYSGFVVSRVPTAGLSDVTPAQIPSISPVTSLKNLLYALQWWVFGLFAGYVWWRWCRDELEREHELAEAREPEDSPVGSGV